jgi:hypothetical protein
MPDTLPTKAEEASLFLFAVSTGARSISCANVMVQDIQKVFTSVIDGKEQTFVQVSQS